MSREVRRVPADWAHPTDEHGDYIHLHDGWELARAQLLYDEALEAWESEVGGAYERRYDGWMFVHMMEDKRNGSSLDAWHGARPDPADYMPRWPDEERTHLQYYEATTEGTPLSPVCETVEQLGEWMDANGHGPEGVEFVLYNISGERPWDKR